MIIGVPREIKEAENRVAMVPAGVDVLVAAGHRVYVEQGAGLGSGIMDDDFSEAGAHIVAGAEHVWLKAEIIVKVKEPLPPEYRFFRPGLVIFTYLHLATLRELTAKLLQSGVRAIGYETVQLADGSLPMLVPMSEVAGKLAVQAGARFLEKVNGGRGVLLGGVTGVAPGRVVILGSGTVGRNAAAVALGMGAMVTVVARNPEKMARLAKDIGGGIRTVTSGPENIVGEISTADLVIGAVLVPGDRAPLLVTREMLGDMLPGSVIVDVAIDQGGCFETSRPTTHRQPVFEEGGIIHYCVANMPGAVPRTATHALTAATLPFISAIAGHGVEGAIRKDPALLKGVNTWNGLMVNRQIAGAQGLEYNDLSGLLDV